MLYVLFVSYSHAQKKIMKKTLSLLVVVLVFSVKMYSQFTVSKTFIRSFTKAQLDSTLNANGIPAALAGTVYDIDVYKLVYNTVNYDSSSFTASGLFVVPKNTTCKHPLMSYAHGSMSSKEDAPSRFNGIEPMVSAITASNGVVSVAPDYLGLGDGPGLHRYQHAATEATATIDLIRAARETCDSLGLQLNGQIFLTGYSQGGHAAMAAHKMIQEKIDNEMHVTASVPMSGAYDMSGVMVDVMLSDSVYPSPSYLAYIVYSWNQMYNLYDTLARPLLSPYDSLMPHWFDGTHGLGWIDGQMPGIPKSIFKPDTVAAFAADTNHPFRLALKENDVTNWLPTSPVKMLFCRADSYVSWKNSLVCYNKMKALGCTVCDTFNVNENLEHQACAQFAILNMKSFFDGLKNIDCSTGLSDDMQSMIKVFPNPVADYVTVSGKGVVIEKAEIVNALGETVLSKHVFSNLETSIDVSFLTPAVYSIRLKLEGNKELVRRIIKQ